MSDNQYDNIKFCAFCPNVCRIYYPRDTAQKESLTPSALSFLGLAVLQSFIDFSEEVEEKLTDLKICRACEKACPYNYKISDDLKSLVKNHQRSISEYYSLDKIKC